MDDPRFSKLFSDPKFRNVPKKQKKVKIDQRFQSLFTDKKFVSKVSVDKRGRPGNFSTKENYEKFYQMDTSSESDEDDDDKEKKEEAPRASKSSKSKSKKPEKTDGKVDYARGEAFLTDSSSEGDSSDEDEEAEVKDDEENEEAFDKWGELDHDAPKTSESTNRLAVCNMDWDRVEADDIFLALSSFCPPGGRLLKVSVFPSEFGKQRMAEEEKLGPQELRRQRANQDSDQDSDAEMGPGDKEDLERVRKYQVNRLKYYFAVAEFNSVSAADRVYEQCDGSEYELSATKFDLRFIPDGMEFKDDPPREVCGKMPDGEKYKPKFFSNTALSLGKVDLTWDETDPNRLQAMQKAFEESDDDNDEALKQYLAASDDDEEQEGGPKIAEFSGDESEDEEKVIAKYRALLSGAIENAEESDEDEDDDDETGKEMIFIPEADLKKAREEAQVENMAPWEKYLHNKKQKQRAKKKAKSAKFDQDQEDAEDGSDDLPSDVDLNDPFFKDLKKSKEKPKKKAAKKRQNEEQPENLELLAMDSDDDRQHFDYKEIVKQEKQSKKRKKAKDRGEPDTFELNVNDDRFSDVFNNPKYNVDPSHPSFKKTKSMASIIEEKQRRILKGDAAKEAQKAEVKVPKADKSTTLSSLANSVKSKSTRMKGAHKKKKKGKHA